MGVLAGYSGARRPPGDAARPAADDHRRPARQPAARRPGDRQEHRRHPHRLAARGWRCACKIIDEYNRIPTRTQSALLTVMGDNYAEMLDQIYECPDAAWYLTANDDAGGGTYQVIEALRDRIDVVVQALAFNTRFLGELLDAHRGRATAPRRSCRAQIIFTEAEIDRHARGDPAPSPCPRRCAGGSSSSPASSSSSSRPPTQFEYKTKDTARLAGRRLAPAGRGRDRAGPAQGPRHARPATACRCARLMTLLVFAKAMAYFRGAARGGPRGPAPDPAVRAARQAGARPRRAVLRGGREPAPSASTASAGCAGSSTCPAPSTTASTSTATTRWRALLTEFERRPGRGHRGRGARPGSSASSGCWPSGARAASSTARLRRHARAEVPPPALHELPRLVAVAGLIAGAVRGVPARPPATQLNRGSPARPPGRGARSTPKPSPAISPSWSAPIVAAVDAAGAAS